MPFFISPAYAQTTGGGSSSVDPTSLLVVLGILFALGFYFFVIRGEQKRKKEARVATATTDPMGIQKSVLIRAYKGKLAEATAAFQAESATLATEGYVPASQNWVPGTYSGKDFMVALLLCFLLIGIIVFIYMAIVKPPGTLNVTYELRAPSSGVVQAPRADEKTCPRCAEQVKAAALVCRFCGHEFALQPA